jgi:hypothetical protein
VALGAQVAASRHASIIDLGGTLAWKALIVRLDLTASSTSIFKVAPHKGFQLSGLDLYKHRVKQQYAVSHIELD